MDGPSETEPPKGLRKVLFRRRPDRDEEYRNNEKLKWNMGMLNDKETIAVPGSVLLLAQRNEPLGLRNTPARTSHSSLPTGIFQETPAATAAREEDDKKKTKDGKIILEPQPDDSHNDPLNWPSWRRDTALLCLGVYCMIGGGITPLIAAGFTDVAAEYNINVAQVSLTTGLYMMGLGIGSVIFSPTAILYGKRPVYLYSAILFIISAVWCALAPNFTTLILGRIFQGIAVSPVECLPSASIAEIYYLHDRAWRLGIYTLLLLSGKNLIPLVSAAIIQRLGWRWVFWIVAMVVAFCGSLLFFFVPETFWDRSPVPRSRHVKRPSIFSRRSSARPVSRAQIKEAADANNEKNTEKAGEGAPQESHDEAKPRRKRSHIGFAASPEGEAASDSKHLTDSLPASPVDKASSDQVGSEDKPEQQTSSPTEPRPNVSRSHSNSSAWSPARHPGSPYDAHRSDDHIRASEGGQPSHAPPGTAATRSDTESEKLGSFSNLPRVTSGQAYTDALRNASPKSFAQQLRVHHGRINQDRWWKAAVRPFILFSYPAVLWSAAIYACSVGWLIVISESVAVIFRQGSYQFSALGTGLVYLSPFIGGVLGTAVAGKVSDVIVRGMARRNGGLYEPEFRLVMAAPVAVTTVVGLMGFGWSAEVQDAWIVPTVFFGIVSFGCSLGSTTSITFCVDSYRQYAGEALVTLNFSKNIFHGLVFSTFVTEWLAHAGSKMVFIWIGVIQLIVVLTTIPMYIYGKRARMWTVRMNLMEKY